MYGGRLHRSNVSVVDRTLSVLRTVFTVPLPMRWAISRGGSAEFRRTGTTNLKERVLELTVFVTLTLRFLGEATP